MGDAGRPSHSSAARVLGNGGNQTSISDGIQCEHDENGDGTCSVELHGNEMCEMVNPDDEDVRVHATKLTTSNSEESSTKQKKSLLPHTPSSQPRQELSVNCLVRDWIEIELWIELDCQNLKTDHHKLFSVN